MKHLLQLSLNRLTYKAGVAFAAFGLVFAAFSARAEIGQEPLPDHPDWGYKITGLGGNEDEVALVFTNTTETTMSWTLPQSVGSIWYLVVGGGGGGGACGGNSYSAGGGGGAGGVLGDYTNGGTSVSITIGAGGLGAKCTSWNRSPNKGGNGGNTSLTVGEVVITAYGGGGGGSANSTAGAAGGCGGGGAGASGTGGTGGSGKVVEGIRQGYDGGSGGSPAAGSGGGGAGEVGAGSSSTAGGTGGDGVQTLITGESWWIAGGGGGGAKITGTRPAGGAGGGGAGGTTSPGYQLGRSGTSYGAGGGGNANLGSGGTSEANRAGAGYQGVVIIRYTEDASEVMVPFVASKTYTGETLTATVAADDRYTVTANDGGVNVGDYTVTLTLTGGCHWNGGSTDPTNLVFTITPAQNAWSVDPAISKGYWLTTDDPGVLTAGATTFGTVTATYTKDGGAPEPFSSLPTEAGEYVITYTAPVSANYSSPDPASKSVSFIIFNVDETPAFTVATNGVMTAAVSAAKVNVSVPYRVECEVQSSKLVDVFAHYALEGSAETNTVKIASEVALDATGTGTLEDLVPGTNYWVSLSGQGGSTVAPTTMPVKVVTPGPATGLTASAVFTNDPKEFVISGSVTPGLGTTTVYLRWSLNSGDLDNLATYTFAFGDTGAFSTNIAYTALDDALTWAVAVSNDFASASYGDLAWNDTRSAQTKTRVDTVATTYTWTGNGGDNLWTNVANWTANPTVCYGYPDNKTYATARFTNGVVVALNGGTFRLVAAGLVVSANRGEVRLQNGTLDFPSSDFSFGASGTDVVFDLVTLTGLRGLKFVSGSKTVFIGNTAQGWRYEPWGINNTRMVVRDGTMSSGYFQVWIATDRRHYVDITNAVWTVNANIYSAGIGNPGSIANVVTLRDGADRQAQFVTTGTMNFTYTWDIKIPEDGHAKPSIQAVNTFENTTDCIFKLDVTDYNRGLKVPLVRFTGADQTARMNNKNFTLQALDNGVDVKTKRNARLEWSATDNTLYYVQDSQLPLVIYIK